MPWGKELPWKTQKPEIKALEKSEEPTTDPVEVWQQFLENNPELQEQALLERRNLATRPWGSRHAAEKANKQQALEQKQARLALAMSWDLEMPELACEPVANVETLDFQAKIDETAKFIASFDIVANEVA